MSAPGLLIILLLLGSRLINEIDGITEDRAEVVVVKVETGLEEVRRLAARHGYKVEGQVGSLEGYYELSRPGKRISKREALETLGSDDTVLWHQLQVPKVRVKRNDSARRSRTIANFTWSDPDYSKQWYLHKGAAGGFDMRVGEAWKMGYSGKGVVISILDDGIQGSHPDLAANYDPSASTDINDKDSDPTPRDNGENKHGTRCAGEVAAVAGNSWCGVGIAFNSSIGGVRMLDGPVSDAVEAASLSFNPDHIDIYSASWGPEDDGKTVDGPGPLAKQAFLDGINKGRQGKGNIFIWASGNGGSHEDSCSCDGYTTSIYTLSVSSATFDHQKPWYLEECPSTLATTYSSGGWNQPAIVTVDMPNSCTDQHTGTSASAPLAAGIVALALEANPELTWRDVQHLVVRTSDPTPLLSTGNFQSNGIGRKVSNKFGYGMMNAEAMTLLARNWKSVPPQHVCTYEYHTDPLSPSPLIGKFRQNYTLNVPGCQGSNAVNYLEQVHAIVSIQYSRRGDLTIKLISPMGTESILLPPRSEDVNPSGFHKWPFLSVQQWGEDPRGSWTLIVENAGKVENSGAFLDFSLVFYGTDIPPDSDVKGSMASSSSTSTPILTTDVDQNFGSPHQNNQVPRDVPSFGESDFLLSNVQNPLPGPNPLKSFEFPSFSIDTGSSSAPFLPGSAIGAISDLDGRRISNFGMTRIIFHNCHKLCDPMKGCYKEDSPYDCVKCSNFSLYKRNRSGKMCVENCGNGSYADLNAKRCKQCLAECETCSNAENCDTCPIGKIMVTSHTGSHLLLGRCLSDCPEGFSRTITGGRTVCAMEKSFQPCGVGYFMTVDKKCVARCPDGSFASQSFECLYCNEGCRTCYGPRLNECINCATGYEQSNSTQLCQPKSSALGTVVSMNKVCGVHEYFDLSRQACASCITKSANGSLVDSCWIASNEKRPHVGQVVLILCAIAVLIFFFIFGCLMWRDRHYDRNAKLYAYSKLPVKYTLGSNEGLIATNTKSGVKDIEDDFNVVMSEDSDEEDTLFPH